MNHLLKRQSGSCEAVNQGTEISQVSSKRWARRGWGNDFRV